MSWHHSSITQNRVDMVKRSADDARLERNSQEAAKKKRPQSCDTCRSRKIKCVRVQVDGLDASPHNQCLQCRAIDARCTFDYVPKRPGPQSSFARTARSEAKVQLHSRASTQTRHHHCQHAAPASSHSPTSTLGFGKTPGAQHLPHTLIPGLPADDSCYRPLAAHNFASASASASPSGSGTQTRSSSWSGGTNLDSYLHNSMLAMMPSQFAAMPFHFSSHNIANMSAPSPSMSVSNASCATPGSYAGSTSCQAATRSDARSSPSAAPLAALEQSMQPHLQSQPQQQAQPASTPSQVDHLHSFHLAVGHADSTAALLSIPSFSRVPSPAASLPHQQQPSASSFGSHSNLNQNQSSTAPQPSLSTMYCAPVLRPRSLQDIAPRQTFLSIVSLYFHYLWPLLPIVHPPTFTHHLLNRRDERDDAFLAFILSLTSYTLIQCPRSVVPAPWSMYRRLHRICHLTSRRMQPRVYDPPRLLHVNTLYCDHIYLGTVGKTNAANAVLAEAVRVAYTLGLHDQRKNDTSTSVTPYAFDASSFSHYRSPIANAVDRELRKRIFWLLHGSSTIIAILQDEPALIHAIDASVDLPLALDEQALANPGHIQRTPSVLSGFLTVTRLHQVMLELLESYRRDRRFPIDDLPVARSRIRYLVDVLRRIQQAIDDMPQELRKPVYTHAPPEPIRRPGASILSLNFVQQQQRQQHAPLLQAIGFDAATQTALGNHLSATSPCSNAGNNDILVDPTAASAGGLTMMDLVNVFHPSPGPSSTPVLSPMCTMHANIVATESLIRFLVTEYRQLVSTRIHDLRLGQASPCSAPEEFGEEEWQEAAQNMLRVFNSLPLDALASNGHSLVSKIIYVVSALLDRTATATGVRRRREGKSGKRGETTTTTTTTVDFQYMSSLLGTLTRLSQTRKDDNASEWWSGEQEQEQDGRGRANGNGGGGGDDGGEASGRHGQRRRSDGISSGQGRSGNSDAGGNNANRHPSGPQLDPSTHSDNGSRAGRDISSTRNRNLSAAGGGVESKQLAPPLTMPQQQQQQQHQEAPFSPYTFSNQSSSNPSSTTSSTTNTASTTPTSEQPAAPAAPSSFYDDPKLVNCTMTALGTQKGMQST
ncbi:hypothetical protein NDA11_003768 [Ustilago hordei]|nr:hypothetical protein NDA10_001410 [Ustilago hordei]KAJ1576658.1 hypothetical protein NDA11_003768 [Ustilago hordei]UTT88938.1 hypothetical protein NDA17_002246 [Ustilago hordei]